jgi:ankyrin repeat protein
MQLLLAQGADVNLRDNKGRTVLMRAKQQGHANFVALLCTKGAKYIADGC